METIAFVNIPDDVASQVHNKLNEALVLLQPYAVHLSNENQQSLLKVGDKSVPFVNKAQGYTESAAEFNLPYLNVSQFKNDTRQLQTLDAMFQSSEQITKILGTNRALVADKSYSAALTYYNTVKQAAADGIVRAKVIYEDLAQRFPGRSRKSEVVSKV
jgi:hypothetical protein